MSLELGSRHVNRMTRVAVESRDLKKQNKKIKVGEKSDQGRRSTNSTTHIETTSHNVYFTTLI